MMIIDRNSPVPQYFQLQTWLLEQITQGVYKQGDKIPTEKEFGEITGLARATIRQAITNIVNKGYLERKKRLGTFVIYKKDVKQRSNIIGVIVPDIRRGYAPELARGIEDEAVNKRLSTILCNSDDLYVQADFHADRLIENTVSGVIFIPTAASNKKNRLILEKFQANDIPVVLADRTIKNVDTDLVTTDNYEGAYKITSYLIKHGHTRIGMIMNSLFSTEILRLEGYKQALLDHDIEIDESVIFASRGPFNEARCLQNANDMLHVVPPVTAIFGGHDRIAYQVKNAARNLLLDIPNDVALVGYDDLLLSRTQHHGISTMHQPIYEMGVESMKLLLERIENTEGKPQTITLKSRLVERASVAIK
ncbi:MAG: GntR family transcriptional regulator [Candidatus Marinimicrobia bacterium]|nr:GntR family transcriptional regulator [Candidatus Neomarinimicrobiota bacterium]MBT3824259.1 GntR family transcriptional regulator [Candidatus Neomarinimicrobiota bacterium]MBT4131711.1 GntR family transcriptional regulator [Candidatus Neomarinimicrobiota bacterium]MBT4295459.1 GntR family transcriptional regulator [Candidatus Neomarinimicrobiota bacterium]MBT4418719.1 GntR family transcriptional regulator [Candidatus Neomarinimicrobiota bacterium]